MFYVISYLAFKSWPTYDQGVLGPDILHGSTPLIMSLTRMRQGRGTRPLQTLLKACPCGNSPDLKKTFFKTQLRSYGFRLNDASKTTGGQAPPANLGQLNGNVPSVFDALTLLVAEFKMIIHRFILCRQSDASIDHE